MRRRALILLTVVSAAGVCAPGCGRPERPVQPVRMRIGVGAPPKGTPTSGFGSVIGQITNETWLTLRPDGQPAERVVNAWRWDDSRTVLRLTLRKDVYFHDGTRLTPELAAAVLSRSVTNREALSLASVRSVVPVGDDGIELRLTERNALLLTDLALASVLMPDRPGVGTGPFSLVKRDPLEAVLRAFPRYYRGRPAIDEIDVTNYSTQRKAWTALMRGEIDMLHEVSRDAVDFVEAETTVKTYTIPRRYYIPLVFSVRHRVLKRAAVRQAINEAVDRAALVRDGLHGRGQPADGPIWPQEWMYAAPAEPFVYDPDSARRKLDAAGLKAKSILGGGVPARFSFTCLVFASDSRFERLAILVQKQLADVGIEMRLLPLAQADLEARLRSGDFDAFLFEMVARPASWVYEFWRSREGSFLNTGYRSADATLDAIRNASSDDAMRAGFAELARVFHDDPPAAFLAWQETSRAVSTRFDVMPEQQRDIMINPWQWRPAAPVTQASR
jgi:peptide/nickel transport system substrate-binding protein